MIDWEKVGLRVGLEIHRQLSGRKLFCCCNGELKDQEIFRIGRRLGISRSEMGDIDMAASFEIAKTHPVNYSITENSCLVEIDEEPPHLPDPFTIDTALMISMLLGSHVPDEILFMRKIVVDGSNPAGFQRTGIVGTSGRYRTESGYEVDIDTVCLEEDAARILDSEKKIFYRVDRLGIPEIEISTRPDITSPDIVKDVASSIGEMLRSTGRVRRGIGTIRQDINVSVKGGNRVELKLVQDLKMIPEIVTVEAIRQLLLSEITIEIRESGTKKEVPFDVTDLTDIFKGTDSRVLHSQMAKGGRVLSLGLKGLAGYFGTRERHGEIRGSPIGKCRKDIDDVKRLGPEIAAYAKTRTGIRGLFHSDELPDYGVTKDEVISVYSRLGLKEDEDAFVLVCADENTAMKALEAVHERVLMAFDGVPGEVRRIVDGTRTEYMRPLPGSARMYPETDVPPIQIDISDLERVRAMFPEQKNEMFKRLAAETGLSFELLSQLYNMELIERFATLVSMGADPKLLSRLLINIIPAGHTKEEGSRELSDQTILMVVQQVMSGMVAKEAMDTIVERLFERIEQGEDESYAVSAVFDEMNGNDDLLQELEVFIGSLLKEKKQMILERKMKAVGPLMGEIMKVFRGKVDGGTISDILSRKIEGMVDEE